MPSAPHILSFSTGRVSSQGSAAGRTEYLRLTIDPKGKGTDLFTFERVPLE